MKQFFFQRPASSVQRPASSVQRPASSAHRLLIALYVLFGFSVDLIAQLVNTESYVDIDPTLPPNPNSKSGYNLILADEFDSFNPETWDTSQPGDDGLPFGAPGFCTFHGNAPSLPYNMLGSSGGFLNLRVHPRDAAEPSEALNTCGFSGCEIKSFTAANDNYQQWKVYPNTFLEARVRIPRCEGVGAAFWLYGLKDIPTGNGVIYHKYSEMDIFEVDPSVPTQFQSTSHIGTGGAGNRHAQMYVNIRDLDGDAIDYDAQWLTFGMEWIQLGISHQVRFYLNNKLYRVISFAKKNGAEKYSFEPMHVRLGTGSGLNTNAGLDMASCGGFPLTFDLDYLRLFQKTGTNPLKPLSPNPLTLCSAVQSWGGVGGTSVSTTHIPGVNYTWNAPQFNFGSYPFDMYADRHSWWVTTQPNLPAGTYNASLTAQFPDGFVQTLPLTIHVTNGTAPTPDNIELVNDGSNCYSFGILKHPNSTAYAWSIDGGPFEVIKNSDCPGYYNITFPDGPGCIQAGTNPTTRHICVYAINDCARSDEFCADKTVPTESESGGCTFCMVVPPPNNVGVEQTNGTPFYHLTVEKNPASVGYEWSFDEETWYSVENLAESTTNNFGEFEAGTPDFLIWVRAYATSEKSFKLNQVVHIPEEPQSYISGSSNQSNQENPAGFNEIFTEPGLATIEQDGGNHVFFVFNSIGQKVFESESSTCSPEYLRQFLAPGPYFLMEVTTEGKPIATKKIVVPSN